MINFGRVEKQIFIGNAPQTSVDVARLKQMKISAVVSLQSDEDLKTHRIDWAKLTKAYEYNDIHVERYPITDFDEDDLALKLPTPVRSLNNLVSVGHTAYVHCNAGVCRAPATVLAYLCHYRGLGLKSALQLIRRERPQANPYTNAVKKALLVLKSATKSDTA